MNSVDAPDRPPLSRLSVRYRFLYAFAGVVLATGAPLGALAIRLATGSVAPGIEVRNHFFYYVYELFGTAVVFGTAGFFAGRRADRLQAGRERFRELAGRDDLTGLPNRRLFREHYGRVAARSHRFGEPVSLLLVDVDGLKEINDRWGHMAGNAVLRHVARIVREKKRTEDLAARWGGDEFVLLLPGADASAAERVAGDILRAAERSALKAPPTTVTVTIGIGSGIAASPEHDFFAAADRALYEGKAAGRNQYRVVRSDLPPPEGPDRSSSP
ncbi:MAG TPA: GGDEF domain-containing protein [Thermoanaerobaculia bacterium]|nr:GGDEF domain-containing protein [Thermoanaerobaculia bacterium]